MAVTADKTKGFLVLIFDGSTQLTLYGRAANMVRVIAARQDRINAALAGKVVLPFGPNGEQIKPMIEEQLEVVG